MDEIDKLAGIFQALSDPTRLRLVKLLSECHPHARRSGECKPDGHAPETGAQEECVGGALCVNALAHELGISQSAVSQHLRILKQAGLVWGERRGSFVHYTLDQAGLKQYKAALRTALGEDFVVG
jgi:DNA-binding transcriptional ArsR family regulator